MNANSFDIDRMNHCRCAHASRKRRKTTQKIPAIQHASASTSRVRAGFFSLIPSFQRSFATFEFFDHTPSRRWPRRRSNPEKKGRLQKLCPVSSIPLFAKASARDERQAPSNVLGCVFLIHRQSSLNQFTNSPLFSTTLPSGRCALSSM